MDVQYNKEGSEGKLEITPQMIQAGIAAYYSEPNLSEDPERLVSLVFSAMWRCQIRGA
jgi:hypothetical protein